MTRKICILHANCQGEALRALLESCVNFVRHFEIRQYCNYSRQEIANSDLEKCDLFLHQYLAPAWGSLSAQSLLARVNPRAQSICIPNFFFKGYWPFWSNKYQEIEFADSALENLLSRGFSPDEALWLYLRGHGENFANVEAIAADSIEHEREKEKFTPLKYVNIIEENWREEQLFLTINHPGKRLIFHMANEILGLLGLGCLPDKATKNFIHPQGNFWLPIHPLVGKRLGLSFASPYRLYECFGRKITFNEYVSTYLACRKHGVVNLADILRGIASIPES